jgi:hypothetical protein
VKCIILLIAVALIMPAMIATMASNAFAQETVCLPPNDEANVPIGTSEFPSEGCRRLQKATAATP